MREKLFVWFRGSIIDDLVDGQFLGFLGMGGKCFYYGVGVVIQFDGVVVGEDVDVFVGQEVEEGVYVVVLFGFCVFEQLKGECVFFVGFFGILIILIYIRI